MIPPDAIRLASLRNASAVVGAAGAVICAAGWLLHPDRFAQSYLLAFVTVTGVGSGCLALVMLHHLVGGRWGRPARGVLESAAWPLVLAPVLAAPLLLNVAALYPWADPEVIAHDELVAAKTPYLNEPFFQARTIGYLLLWGGLAAWLSRWSRADRREASPARRRRNRLVSGGGLVLWGLTTTFAAVDWMMSLEPHWFSAIYGVIVIAGQGAASFAVAILTLAWLWRPAPAETRPADRDRDHAAEPEEDVFQDLGNLLLAAVIFWMYVSFSQFLIIWSGNLAEETPWYLRRSDGGWQWVAAALAALHFLLPFAALLSARVKRRRRTLAAVALLVLAMHVVDLFWQVMPALRDELTVHWLDVAALAAVAGTWKALGLWRLSGVHWPAVHEQHETGAEHGGTRSARHPA